MGDATVSFSRDNDASNIAAVVGGTPILSQTLLNQLSGLLNTHFGQAALIAVDLHNI